MKKIIALISVLPVLLALLLGGCTVDDPTASTALVAPAGDQLFANYVAIGNSLTAGFMDGGLVIDGQLGSYPNLIAGQIGAPSFTQPYISYPGVGSTKDPDNHPADVAGVMHWTGSSISITEWTPAATVMDASSGFLMAVAQPTPYHNLGVPGATLHDVLNAYDAYTSTPVGNSYFNFINRESLFGNVSVAAIPDVSPAYQTASMFWATIAKGPKLLTCWIGNNDILGSAMAGTDAAITPTGQFQTEYTALLRALAGGLMQRNGFPSTIIVANIPSITSIPYFVPIAFLEAASHNGLGINWPWGDVEADAEMITLPGLSWLQNADNYTNQVPAGYTLSAGEMTGINTAVANFNGIIAAVATAVNASGYATCGVMDANTLLAEQTATARTHFMFLVGSGSYTVEEAAAATMFSLDGVHPNNRGYGIVANGFIAKINELCGTSVPDVDLTALSWDPTYEQAPVGKMSAGLSVLSPEVAASMNNLFR